MATTQETVGKFEKHVINNYGRTAETLVVVRGEGCYFWDSEGRRYLDMFPGWAVSLLGHCHPKVVAALREQAGRLIHIDNTFYPEPQGRLAEMISTRSFGGKCFFCNSGTEANEAALKLARLATGQKQYKFISMADSFHGRTYGSLSVTGQAKFHKGVDPVLPGARYIPFNDVAALKEAFDEEVAGVLVEPVQGEGGIRIATGEFLETARELCDRTGALLIFDEVQTGCGRTGEWFGYQNFDVVPDIMTLAKALGNGVPIGAMVARPEAAEKLVPGTHASTYGGNPLVCAAGCAVFEAIEQEDLLAAAKRIGQYAVTKLEALGARCDVIDHVRGLGLMIGIQLTGEGGPIVAKCLELGLRINCTHGDILRFMPAMVTTEAQIDEAVEILEKAIGALASDG
jgi:acetylornithine/N-succinyldiaminopimelate aminotransferase